MKFYTKIMGLWLLSFILTTDAHELNFHQSSDWCEPRNITNTSHFSINHNEMWQVVVDYGVYCPIPMTDEAFESFSSNAQIMALIGDFLLQTESNGANDITHGIIDQITTAYAYCSCAIQQEYQVVDPRNTRVKLDLNGFNDDIHHNLNSLQSDDQNKLHFSCYICEK